jgi:hypothetical protein
VTEPEGAELVTERPGIYGPVIFPALIFVLAVVFFVKSLAIDSSAEIWPRTLALLLAMLAAAQTILALRPVLSSWGQVPRIDGRVAARRAFTALWMLAFACIAPFTGFGVVILVMMPLYMWLAGVRRPLHILVATLATAALVTLIFANVAGVPIWEADL